MRGTTTFLAMLLVACGGNEDTATDTSIDIVDIVGDSLVDPGQDDVVSEVECASDGDCDDSNPCTVDSCDTDYSICSHEPFDGDGDGYAATEVDGTDCGGTDCNDADPLTGDQECTEVNPCCDGCNDLGCWYDYTTGYLWEDPPAAGCLNWSEAIGYCAALSLAGRGAGSWELPTIGTIRTMIRGCSENEDGGSCGVTDECLDSLCRDTTCYIGCVGGGPGTAGCYRDPAMDGECGIEWSSSTYTTFPDMAWVVGLTATFGCHIGFNEKNTCNKVRCVSL